MNTYFSIEALSPLYETVQSAKIFADLKFFVDCTPQMAPSVILENYEKQQYQADFDLKTFVETHFAYPQNPNTDYQSAQKPIEQHLETLWNVLTRTPDETGGTLIPLPFPYIVPGGRFREIYYWDSYFTMLGLQVSGRVDIIENMVNNFAYLIQKMGFIPNGNRTYYLSRSQPPFFSLMVGLLKEIQGQTVLLKYQTALEKEYQFWMDGAESLNESQPAYRRVVRMEDGSVLNRYWDDKTTPRPESYLEDVHTAQLSSQTPATIYRHIRAAAESGWDFSSRWFKDAQDMGTIQTTDLIPVDLNSLMLHLEETLLQIYENQLDTLAIQTFQSKIMRRKAAIQTYCWQENKGFYGDFNHVENCPTEWATLAGVAPLFFNIARPEQADKVANLLEKQFLQAGGLTTTLQKTGHQWDAPNGWAPLQWMAYQGLKNYGHTILADKIKENWLKNNQKVYRETGKMMEKYDVMNLHLLAGGGEYPNQDGFGWTNGVYLKLTHLS
jgi:alpha,alpha-trehalase